MEVTSSAILVFRVNQYYQKANQRCQARDEIIPNPNDIIHFCAETLTVRS
jgi:hypothetical protein